MKAFDKGFAAGKANEKQKYGRAYETDKANREYFDGYAKGIAAAHPSCGMVVQCTRDSTIFPAYPQAADTRGKSKYVTCPTCDRRYFKEEGKEHYESDRTLKILIRLS